MTRYAYDPTIPAQQTNGLGIAGFICSLAGLVSAGILSPIGLIISLIALTKQPRGFAIAGVILGLIGSCGAIFVLLVFGGIILALLAGAVTIAALALSNPEKTEITADMAAIAIAIENYKEENNYLPAGLELLGIGESTLVDPWGTKYRYEQIDPKDEFDLVTAGADRTFDTGDDFRLSKIDQIWGNTPGVKVWKDDGNGRVRIDFGDRAIDVSPDSGGTVKVNAGGRTIEIETDAPDSPAAPPSAPARTIPAPADEEPTSPQ